MISGIHDESSGGKKSSREPALPAGGIERGDFASSAASIPPTAFTAQNRQQNHHPHLQHELKQVGHQHAPQAGDRRVERREQQHADQDQQRNRRFDCKLLVEETGPGGAVAS